MQIGKMNNRITIKRESITRDNYGQEIKSWITLTTVYANQRQLSGIRRDTGEIEYVESKTQFTIRYYPNLSTKDRVVNGSDTYRIESISDTDGRKKELKLLCVRLEN